MQFRNAILKTMRTFPRRSWKFFFQMALFATDGLWGATALSENVASKPVAGLSVRFSGVGDAADVASAPNVWLYVLDKQPPTPFLSAGKFTAVWTGFISADLRGDYSFQAELNGAVKIEINGQPVLEAVGTNSTSELTKPIRLNKGTNAFVATFNSPTDGDAFVRLRWKPKDSFPQPIPLAALTHFPSAEEQAGKKLRLGRELFVEHRCVKCHAGPDAGMPELAMDAPSFEELGACRNQDWMARWIADPKVLRTAAHMPKLFPGDSAKANSEAIATFLASLRSTGLPSPGKEPERAKAESGKKLFETLHCIACHNAPDSLEVDANKISLKQVRAKFAGESLIEFLKQPDSHYAWIRMPRFNLSDEQREHLAAYLLLNSDKSAEVPVQASPEAIARGKALVQTSGCF